MNEETKRLAWEFASNQDKVILKALAARMNCVVDKGVGTETFYVDGKPLVTFYDIEMKQVADESGVRLIATRCYQIHS